MLSGKNVKVYKNLSHDKTYGNLALDNYWQEEEEEVLPKVKKVKRRLRLKDLWAPFRREDNKESGEYSPYAKARLKCWRFCGIAVVSMFLGAYFSCVVLNQMITAVSMDLVSVKRAEAELMKKNSEMKIVVEELKGPERIREIAMKQLGMVVARDNMYVRASKGSVVAGNVEGRLSELGGQQLLAVLEN